MINEITGEKTLCAVHFLSHEPIQLSFARFVHCLSPLLALFSWHTVNLCLDGPQFKPSSNLTPLLSFLLVKSPGYPGYQLFLRLTLTTRISLFNGMTLRLPLSCERNPKFLHESHLPYTLNHLKY